MVDNRGTLTAAERAALEYLADGPALLGPSTGTVARRPLPSLYTAANDTLAGARLADAVNAADRRQEVDRLVDRKTAVRLAKAGLIVVVHGLARLPDPEPDP